MIKISEYLKKLGLTEIETKLYLGLLTHGPSTIKDLAEYTGLNRVTTHFQVNNLISKGLANEQKRAARRQIVAESPEKLTYLIDQQEKNVSKLKEGFPDFLKTVSRGLPHSTSTDQEVEVKFYKGQQGVQLIYDDVLRCHELRAYVNANEIAKVFPDNVKLFMDAHNKREDMFVWEIMNKPTVFDYTKYTVGMDKKRHFVKFVPGTIDLSIIDYMIYDDKVAIVNIRDNPTGLIIINKDYYENAKALFNFVWAMLPDV
jgi:sugar-specific transcriptional regulator TrmB